MRLLFPAVAVSILASAAPIHLQQPESAGGAGQVPEAGPATWSPTGDHVIWRAPYGGSSGIATLGDRVCVQGGVQDGASIQERITCLDANTGTPAWDKQVSVNHTDSPPERVGSATPALDPETGAVYALTASGVLLAYTRTGFALWIRDLTEEFGFVPGVGPTPSPVVAGPLVMIGGITAGWGETGPAAQRYLAFDTRTGENVWIGALAARPSNVVPLSPLVTDVDGVPMLVAEGGDTAWHGLVASTGSPVWRSEASMRGQPLGAIHVGRELILAHGDEGTERSAGGVVAAFSPGLKGETGISQPKWSLNLLGLDAPATAPVSDGRRIYFVSKGGALAAVDAATGKALWSQNFPKLAAPRGAVLLLADGNLYLGTADARFLILRLRSDGADLVSDTRLGSAEIPENASATAVSGSRLYLRTSGALYALGPMRRIPAWTPPAPAALEASTSIAAASVQAVQVVPADGTLVPGETISFRVRLFDGKGRFVREEGPPPPGQTSIPGRGEAAAPEPSSRSDVQWSLDGLPGAIQSNGNYVVPDGTMPQTGRVVARAGGLRGEGRVRIVPRRWETAFDEFQAGAAPSWWIGARDRFVVKPFEGGNVLAWLADNPLPYAARARTFFGLHRATNFTMQADVRMVRGSSTAGDGGVLAQGYELVASSHGQQLELRSWQGESTRTKSTMMPFDVDVWYRLKLRVELLLDGGVRARGKAWIATGSEPDMWNVERQDAAGAGQLVGSPGLSASGPSGVYFDNLKVLPD